MEPNTTNDPFLAGGFVLVILAFLVSAAVLDARKKKNQPSPSYFGSDFDSSIFVEDDDRQVPFDDSEDLYTFSRSRLRLCSARQTTPRASGWN